MSVMRSLTAREILDSRGTPTVEATCGLEGDVLATASVPSGRSTGTAEAHELRDGDARRYRGKGCLRAASSVNHEIARALVGRPFETQEELDVALIALDGSPDKSRLGANAILAVSVAFARAQAQQAGLPLYRHFSRILGAGSPAAMPRLTINLFSGGEHAGKQVAIQDVLVVPLSPSSIDESLVMMDAIWHAAAESARRDFGMRALVADEGGLAPAFPDAESMIRAGTDAIRSAGYEPGRDAALAVDVAASHFHEAGSYRIDGRTLSPAGMIDLVAGWAERHPILSVEDGLAEDDWDAWPLLRARLRGRCLVLGDDLLCTNPGRIQRAAAAGACDALLLKVNQVGTLTEAALALRRARAAGWQVTLSVRSGETEDTWAADLAVGWEADQFKNGSIQRSERLAKYNRLLGIEAETRWPVRPWARQT